MALRPKFNIEILENQENNNIIRDTKELEDRILKAEDKQDKEFNFKFILGRKIRANQKNNYPMEDIEQLENSILTNGLQHNLVVLYSLEENMYILESGERRKIALDNLVQRYAKWEGDFEDPWYLLYKKNVAHYEKGYPCKVSDNLGINVYYDKEYDSEEVPDQILDSEIRLIIANEDVRVLDPNRRTKNIARLIELYQTKNSKRPKTQQINIYEKIAEDLGLSRRQVYKYGTISNKLQDSLKKEFEANNITVNDAEKLANLPNGVQNKVAVSIQEGHTPSSNEIDELVKDKKRLEENLKKEKCIIQNKETKIKELEEAIKEVVKTKNTLDRDTLDEINEAKDTIEGLTKELEKAKRENKQKPIGEIVTVNLSEAAKKVCAEEIQLKALLSTGKNSFKQIKQLATTFHIHVGQIPDEELKQLDINPEDIEKQMKELISLLNE